MIQNTEYAPCPADLIVVGGGLAGLSAAALVARSGRSVVVLERSGQLGGRAVTHVRQGVHFNLGAHALYCHGHASRVLRDLGVPFSGDFPNPGRGLLFWRNVPHPILRGAGSLLASRLLGLREKWRFARFLKTLARVDSRALDRVPLRDWIEQTAGSGAGGLADLLRMLVRVSTYADDPARMSAGAAVDQLKLAVSGNVWYLDGGWQSLVDGLRDAAVGHGAEVRTGTAARAESVQGDGDGVSVRLAGGELLRGRAVILAVGPKEACDLLELPADSPLARWTSGCLPVRAACLDVALDRLPLPDRRVAFGLDRPLYYSVHSAAARLAPEGVAVIHLMKYLGSDRQRDLNPSASGEDVERELESFLDRIQPGWGARTLVRRFLPGMVVAHALPRAEEGGLAGRPGVRVPERPDVFLAGDWVGSEGLLADASAASAEEAARHVLAALARIPAGQDPQRRPLHVGN